MGKIINLFKEFWCDNIKTNYKKISIAIGSGANMILGAVMWYYIDLMSVSPDIRLATMIIVILVAIWGIGSMLILSFFGKTKNGNGYELPESKMIIDLVKADPDLQGIIKEKVVKRLRDSIVFNGD